jgi:ketosteroid isomerase-like protein
MKSKQKFSLLCSVLIAALPTAWAAPPQGDADAIRHVMLDQQAAWNRSDVAGYMSGYKNAENTTFVAAAVRRGYQEILASYRKHYTSPEQMGHLTFTELDIRLLPGVDGEVSYAVVTGRFHLDRRQHGEVTKDDGVFSLVWQKTSVGWKIILDHTS